MAIFKGFEFADATPLIIMLGEDKWINPYIHEWYQPLEGSEYDNNMYRVYFKNKAGENMYVFFKSEYLDTKVNNYFSKANWEDKPKQDIFKAPYIESHKVYEGLEMTLLEDAWGPTPPTGGQPIRNSREYAKWKEEALTGQFCFSEFGEKVNHFFSEGAEVDFFSLDCGLTTDGSDWWCDS